MEANAKKSYEDANNVKDPEVSLELLERNHKKNEAPTETPAPSLFFSRRLLVAIMLLLCNANFQVLRNNMNIAVVEMSFNRSFFQDNATIIRPAEFEWESKTVGVVTSIQGYGGLFAFVGGFLATSLGGSLSCGVCMFVSGIMTILHPAALQQDFYIFLICRFLAGLFEAFFYVCTTDLSVRWFPKKERSMLISFSFNGNNVGAAITYPLCGYLAHHFGWKMVFYGTGGASVFLSMMLLILVKNTPSQDKTLSKKELAYILEDTDIDVKKQDTTNKIPMRSLYKHILTSMPVWALTLNHFTYMWIATILGACLPIYAKDLTQRSTDEVGLLSSIPNVIYMITLPNAAAFMDYWSRHSSTTTTQMHKILLSIAYLSGGVFFVAIILLPSFIISLIFFVIIQLTTVFIQLILILVSVSLAPDYSAHICGLTTAFYSLGGIFAQTVTGYMTPEHSILEWNNCFLLASGLSVLGALIFLIFGSSEEQPWSKETTKGNSINYTNYNGKLPDVNSIKKSCNGDEK